MVDRARVAFVQDHLVQRGGAERGLLSMLKAAPDADVYASFYHPDACYPEFRDIPMRTLPLDRIGPLRRHHRMALPLLPAAISRWRVEADVVVCGTSGWAQGVRTDGRKIVYCYALTRWLYEVEAYLKFRGVPSRAMLAALRPYLARWDRMTMSTAHRFVTEGTVMRDRLREIYGVEAEIVPLPNALDVDGPQRSVEGVEPGFFLCASRLVPYKNIDAVVAAFARLPAERLVIAGDGPLSATLRAMRPSNVVLNGVTSDDQLRWLYANCAATVSAAYEPFGLTPIEAAAFGKPSVVLRGGGFVDTVEEDETGVFFEEPTPAAVAAAISRFGCSSFRTSRILAKATEYGEPLFVERIRDVIQSEAALV
jgi:glycosyltransferase involved in cell wall biosynthesis